MKKEFLNKSSIRYAIFGLFGLWLIGDANMVIAQPQRQSDNFETQLWNPQHPVCILVHNPKNEDIDLPEPHSTPPISEIYGPDVSENDLARLTLAPGLQKTRIILVGDNITMVVTYVDGPNEGFNDANLGALRRNAFEFGMTIWAANLQGPAEISISAEMTPLGGDVTEAVLASAAPAAFYRNFTTAPFANTFYPESLVEIISGSDPDTDRLDINVEFNSDVDNNVVLGNRDWYYGLDAMPGNDIDFVTVTIHELCHGLGFISSFNNDGSFGGGSGDPWIFDRFLVNSSGSLLISIPVSPGNVINDNVFWNGLRGRFVYQNEFETIENVPMYAPAPYEAGSSIGHLDEVTFGGDWDLMSPGYSAPNHRPDNIVLGILQDIGYSLPKSRYVDINASGFEDGSSAYPFNDLAEGWDAVPDNGALRILPGSYPGKYTFDKPVQIHSSGGTAVLGAQ